MRHVNLTVYPIRDRTPEAWGVYMEQGATDLLLTAHPSREAALKNARSRRAQVQAAGDRCEVWVLVEGVRSPDE